MQKAGSFKALKQDWEMNELFILPVKVLWEREKSKDCYPIHKNLIGKILNK